MNINQPQHLTDLISKINIRKDELLKEIENDITILKNNNIIVDIDINELRLRNTAPIVTANKQQYIELRDKLAELNFLERISPLIKDIPTSNGTSYFKKADINIGIIADEFLYNSLKDVANFHYVERDKYEELEGKIDVLLIASAWRGLNNEWKGMGNPKISKMRKTIFQMIDFYKKKGVKIVFYSKEDPTNYEYFVDIAQKCDYIFTTAAEKVEDYKRDCNNDNVFVLEFGVNPIYNNPIGIKSNTDLSGALFAGSWYKKYPERQTDTRMLFDGVINAGESLKILDRNYALKLEQHFFPNEYLSYISPGVDHETLQQLTKLYEWVINLNTVKYSQTMFANRVYELQAMGNLILSNYSLGINNFFPNIFFAFDESELEYIMQNYNTKERYQHRMFGVRKALKEHTTFHRINSLLKNIGYDQINLDHKKVAVVVKEKSEKVQSMFDYQTYPYKFLVTDEELQSNNTEYDYVAFLNEEYYYGEYYLEDMVNAFKYTNVDYITKDSYFNGDKKVDGIENNYVDRINSKYQTIFSLEKFNVNDVLDDLRNVNLSNGYSSDSLEFNLTEEPVYPTNEEKKFTVIIPTYNNGQHLYGKCFMSLRRSTMFDDMEIIIVDDGSKDVETLMMIHRLERLYSNVKLFTFNDGGSGSASRPRNKGVELSTTNYITFLDPDNEAVSDGYTKLYNEMQDTGFDLVIGNMKKCDVKESVFNYYRDVVRYEEKTEFINHDVRSFLSNTFFKAQSIQALMIKKDVLATKNLKMIEKAVGEDTLFFHELIANAKSFKVIDEVIHIYYAGVQGSAVNYITESTFEKYHILEQERISFLKKYDLINAYLEKRFNYYFKNWYLKKLELVHPNSYKNAATILYKIYMQYENHLSRNAIDSEIRNSMKKIKKSYHS